MRKLRWISLILFLACLPAGQAQAQGWRKDNNYIDKVNKHLAGKVIDHTANHGTDNRIWSRSLFQRRDMYVYLPPGFQDCNHYPVMIWLHGFCQDEKSFLEHVVPVIDAQIKCGKLPPLIVAAPDGSITGEPHPSCWGSFFLNSQAGDFADFVLYDVFDFLVDHYPIRPEREAHILAGASMGGFAAYNYGIKHRDAFGAVIGISPLLNVRWVNKQGHYHADFCPKDWGWRMDMEKGHLLGIKGMCFRHWFEPLFGSGPNAVISVSQENPIELLAQYQVAPGDLEMYVAYSKDEEWNIDAQVESFLYLAKWRGLPICVDYRADGKQGHLYYKNMLPGALEWLAPRLAPYSSASCAAGACNGLNPLRFGPYAHQKRHMHKGWRGYYPVEDYSYPLPPMWLPEQLPEELHNK